jgi:hypothetical protein
MDVELRYRTELADQFIERLARLSPEQWSEVIAHHERDNSYYRLAVELLGEATQLLGVGKVALYEAALGERRVRVATLVRDVTPTLEPQLSVKATTLASHAMHALFLRDSYGFNAGAFGELIAPFRPYVDLPELERAAARRVTPAGVSHQPPAASR